MPTGRSRTVDPLIPSSKNSLDRQSAALMLQVRYSLEAPISFSGAAKSDLVQVRPATF